MRGRYGQYVTGVGKPFYHQPHETYLLVPASTFKKNWTC